MVAIKRVIIVGESGAGKSTLVAILRTLVFKSPSLSEQINFPIRYCSRKARVTEDRRETTLVGRAEFQQLVEQGAISIWWTRQLEQAWDESHYYGFAQTRHPTQVLSANSAFFLMPRDRLNPLLRDALVVYVTAPAEARAARLIARSPEIGKDEIDARVAEKIQHVRDRADLVIQNSKNDLSGLLPSAFSILGQVTGAELVLEPA